MQEIHQRKRGSYPRRWPCIGEREEVLRCARDGVGPHGLADELQFVGLRRPSTPTASPRRQCPEKRGLLFVRRRVWMPNGVAAQGVAMDFIVFAAALGLFVLGGILIFQGFVGKEPASRLDLDP